MTSTGLLGVHIIGRGYGESIVVSLPNGQIGVVDCFSSKLRRSEDGSEVNPVLRFLKRFKKDELAFVCLTHPHEDHCRGISHVLAEFSGQIGQVWLFYGWESLQLERYFKALLLTGKRLPIEEILNEPAGTFSLELIGSLNLIFEEIDDQNEQPLEIELLVGYRRLEVSEEPVVCHILGPRQNYASDYLKDIVSNIEDVIDAQDRVLTKEWKPQKVNHNRVSPALLLEYGETRVLLGGDMEEAAWTRTLEQSAVKDLAKGGCQLIKVSHHGSINGYSGQLYRALGRTSRPKAVLTPYNRSRSPLPTEQGIDALREWTSSVESTSLAAANDALGRAPEGVAVPFSWISKIQHDPSVAEVLVPSLVRKEDFETPPAQQAVGVPCEWISDLKRNWKLTTLIRREYRKGVIEESAGGAEEAFRISYFFDDKGKVVKMEKGGMTGFLQPPE